MDPELDNNDNKFNEEIIPKEIIPEDDTINLDLKIEIDEDKQLKEIDPIFVEELRENISRNSLEIDDLKSSTLSQISEDSNPTPRSHSDKKYPQYVYASTFDEALDDSEEWTDLKRYRFQKCLWKLKYNRIVSSFYLDNLNRSEQKWSWMIVVISTLTSGLTVANNVEGEETGIKNYNTYINVLLTVSSMSTSLIAAWIKKQMFIERINQIDKFLIDLNALCEDLEIQLSLLNTDRLSYSEFKKKYIPQMTQYLTTNPIIPPEEWKKCIKEITMDYPELLNIDDSEDNKMWPWYGDLIYDINEENENNEDIHHARHPTSFYRRFKKTNKEKLRSSCCGKTKSKNVYNNNNP
jgi:hypothetical protein